MTSKHCKNNEMILLIIIINYIAFFFIFFFCNYNRDISLATTNFPNKNSTHLARIKLYDLEEYAKVILLLDLLVLVTK